MAIQIQLRRDTEAQWASVNPTLAQGEFGIETDTNLFKIGDGSTAWNSLDYAGGGGPGGGGGSPEVKQIGANYTVIQGDDGVALWRGTSGGNLNLTLPNLNEDTQFVLLGFIGGTITLNPTGGTSLFPAGVNIYSGPSVFTAASFILRGNVWYVSSATVPDTVTVVYSGGWGDRPVATHVFAVGHSSAPSWLTSADVWLQAV